MEYVESVKEAGLREVLTAINDESGKLKMLLKAAVNAGVILKKGFAYELSTGEILGDYDTTLAYLQDEANNVAVTKVKRGIEDFRKKNNISW